MKKIVTIVASMVAMLGLALVPLTPTPVYADCSGAPASEQAACGACEAEEGATWTPGVSPAKGSCTRPAGQSDLNGIIHSVINIMLFIVGILSVVMIVFGGIRYASSAGNKSAVDSAKNTIIYAVVGLVVAIVAFALVQWIFSSLS